MENDSVRAMGESTLVDLWIDGKFRAITVSRQAIERYLRLPPDRAEFLTETDRREFVRTHLSLVIESATNQLHASPGAEAIVIDQLGGDPLRSSGERRSSTDRRKGDRRKQNLGPPAGRERRR